MPFESLAVEDPCPAWSDTQESPIGYVVDFKNGKAVRYRDYFDPNEALEAAGLSE